MVFARILALDLDYQRVVNWLARVIGSHNYTHHSGVYTYGVVSRRTLTPLGLLIWVPQKPGARTVPYSGHRCCWPDMIITRVAKPPGIQSLKFKGGAQRWWLVKKRVIITSWSFNLSSWFFFLNQSLPFWHCQCRGFFCVFFYMFSKYLMGALSEEQGDKKQPKWNSHKTCWNE